MEAALRKALPRSRLTFNLHCQFSPALTRMNGQNIIGRSLLDDLIAKNKPFRIETAAGRLFDVPHRDLISFSPRKTALFISYEENGDEHFAIVPLLTVTAAMARASGQ